ncbi:MAG: type II toxin-antitoxin system VapB family antitoxin [Actinomycetota bacterium]|nr:type II toxin-antitoxin system VapB family antitoxin [Actinomycetota bacterium]
MPKPTHTPLRNVRVEEGIWNPARKIAAARGESISDVIRDALRRYVARNRHLLDEDEDE